jgi:hypothetical protein
VRELLGRWLCWLDLHSMAILSRKLLTDGPNECYVEQVSKCRRCGYEHKEILGRVPGDEF